jgi:hypothetical protein
VSSLAWGPDLAPYCLHEATGLVILPRGPGGLGQKLRAENPPPSVQVFA